MSINNGFTNMAIDEALLQLVSQGKSLPVIRFYNWLPSAISFGFFQNISKINVENCKKLNVDYIRRLTGGGSILHDYNRELTYSVIAPLSLYSKNLVESFKQICEPLLSTLSYLGLDPYISNANDICIDGRKISGNAQVRIEDVLLQHGTMIYDLDFEKMLATLNTNMPSEKAKEKITYVKEHSDISLKELYEIMKEEFCKGKDFSIDSLTEEELSLAKNLAETKYNTLGWNNGTSKERLRGACYLN